VGSKERAWMCAGYTVVVNRALPRPRVIAVGDEVPVLCLPPGLADDPDQRELAFGWAMADLSEQRVGWLGLLRKLSGYLVPRALEEAS
jgi:hypothetical protein